MQNLQPSDITTAAVNYVTLSAFIPSQGAIDQVFTLIATALLSLVTKFAYESIDRRYKRRQIRKAKAKISITKKQPENEKISE